jgi:hypothetical protein
MKIQGAMAMNSTLTITNTGFYWLHLSAGVPPNTQCEIRIKGLASVPDLIRAHSTYSLLVDTISRDGIIPLTNGDRLTLSSTYPHTSDGLLQTSFAGFNIGETMSRVTAFYLGKSFNQTSLGLVSFDAVHVDTELAWSSDYNNYKVRVAGIYALTFSVGARAEEGFTVSLKQSGTVFTQLYMTDVAHSQEDTLSRTQLRYLEIGDTLTLELEAGTIYSDVRYVTSFGGFLYSPISTAVAWCLFSTVGLTTGPVDPLSFQEVFVNLKDNGGGWDPIENKYYVPLSGVYYIHLTAGLQTGTSTGLIVLKNDYPLMDVTIGGEGRNGYDTRGRAIITRLFQGDELRVLLPGGFSVYSSGNRITSFTGFKLHD